MKERERFDPLAIVSKIADQEKQLPGTTFIAPYIGGGKVRLRLVGIVYEMQAGQCPEGWNIMEVTGAGKARFVQSAAPSMIKAYLQLFPRLRLILIDRFEERMWALAASTGEEKIQLTGPVPVYLSERASSFDTVYCRFDGACFWFEGVDRRRDPAVARYLRKAIAEDLHPDSLHCKGMVPQERLAYKMLYLKKHNIAEAAPPDESTRIARALDHAGARLDAFWYTGAGERASVRFFVDGSLHVVEVAPRDLSVISAGICLSGQDSNFDLTSLVGVLREANNQYYMD